MVRLYPRSMCLPFSFLFSFSFFFFLSGVLTHARDGTKLASGSGRNPPPCRSHGSADTMVAGVVSMVVGIL